MAPRRNNTIFSGVDWITVIIYLVLVLLGWFNIFAAVYNEESNSIFDLSRQYGAQMIWICVSIVIAITILLVDDGIIYTLSYPIYILTIITLVGVLLFGTEVNGAKAWFQIGSFRLQPAEFAKFATGLAVASFMNSYGFSLKRFSNIAIVGCIAFLPAILIILQNDAGSALVYSSFLIILYREGFASWVFSSLIVVVLLFIFSFLFESWALLSIFFFLLLLLELYNNKNIKNSIVYLSVVILIQCLIFVADLLFFPNIEIKPEHILIISVCITLPVLIYKIAKRKIANSATYILVFFVAVSISLSVDFLFNEVLRIHQQKRILDTLGLVDDAKGWGYNVNQSEIAIGSGGFLGKGYLNGTQTKFNFVPEQSTDFIFCTIGEEWGFVGSVFILSLFLILIIRLMRMGDNQRETFGRVYCYFAASVLLFHVVINIGMTIGVLPVIGIPLPFFSYGGSSLMAFTVLLFIAIRLNCRKEEKRNF